jgi:peptidoglycan biosynthesis protein MviN/MurJ (putative lipid II flippase)
LLLSEFVLFGGLIGLRFTGVNHSKVFLKAGITVSLSLYFIAVLVSVLFAGGFRENLNIFILIELAIIVLFAVIAISIFACSGGIKRREEYDAAKVGIGDPKRGGF